MLWTVGVLAVLSAVGGLLQFTPFWTPLTHWLDPVAPPTADPSGTQELIASVCAVALGLAGIWVAYAAYVDEDAQGAEARSSSSRRSSTGTSSTTRSSTSRPT